MNGSRMRLDKLFVLFLCLLICNFVYGKSLPDNTYTGCSRRNEEYTACGPSCPETCDSLLSPPRGCVTLCVPGCFCKNGYVRNRWGNCIPKEQCPCKNPNEIFTCASCQTTCDNLNQACPKEKCIDSCNCKDGFARDKQGICISIFDCSKL